MTAAVQSTYGEPSPTVEEMLCIAAMRLRDVDLDEPVREAQILMALAIRATRLDVITSPGRLLIPVERQRFKRLVSQRMRHVPLAHLRRSQEFYGLEFEVGPDVLVPRPETELLVEIALETLGASSHALIVDAGTGSGCIAIAIARNLPQCDIIGSDRSAKALAVARRNANRHEVDRNIEFVRSNFLQSITSQDVDLIVSNPPYIPTGDLVELQPEVRNYEPRVALDGGADGLNSYRILARECTFALKSGGRIAVEVGAGQSTVVSSLFECVGLELVEVRKDLAGIERVVVARKP